MPPKDQTRPDLSQYNYDNLAHLVVNTDRRGLPKREDGTGEPESLKGKLTMKDMGNRVVREEAPQKESLSKQGNRRSGTTDVVEDEVEQLARRAEARRARASGRATATGRGGTILDVMEGFEQLSYTPRGAANQENYELILNIVGAALDGQPRSIIISAADEVLSITHDDSVRDLDKKKAIDVVTLNALSAEQYNNLVSLSKRLTDYGIEEDVKEEDRQADAEGVAVIFDQDEDDQDDEENMFEEGPESQDDLSDEDERPADAEAMSASSDDELVLGATQESQAKKRKAETEQERIPVHQIDGLYLQRLMTDHYTDPHERAKKASEVMAILEDASIDVRGAENSLVQLFNFEKFDLIKILLINRDALVWCTKLAQANPEERVNIEVEMRESGKGYILKELAGDRSKRLKSDGTNGTMETDDAAAQKTAIALGRDLKTVDLESMIFQQGGHLMSNKKCRLPEGSFKRPGKGYEEIHVPAPKQTPVSSNELISVASLPDWMRPAFKGAETLNRVQSRVYPVAYGTDENMLLCAPTGAGKTNCAMLTILNEVAKYRDADGVIDLESFKIIYVAPMKALVQEMVGNFTKRLAPFGITVNELTGDRQLTKAQIVSTQVIVTTPEKWDVITRKSTDLSYTNLVRLLIIDEIHLLHDERGPVLESIVVRTIRRMEETQQSVRLVGLSATLPNYQDVATFLRVDPKVGLFYFDATFRPCPLKQQFIGITEKKAIKRLQVSNDVCYQKVMDNAGTSQTLIFVHSRKETGKTAQFLKDTALAANEGLDITRLVASRGSQEILAVESNEVTDQILKEVMRFGIGIHHAGMTRNDRQTVEDLFADGHLSVLVSTATLAWGVNLPAHTVIIKGTSTYSPQHGKWVELSLQDVLQMLGRAGRPGYDTDGEGIIITSHTELQYYLSLLNQQLPIESQFVNRLADNLNAEVVLGTIRSRDDAVKWLGYTYLFVRMLQNPPLYAVTHDYLDEDPTLAQRRFDIAHTALNILDRTSLVRYERKTGKIVSTQLGKIASHYYIGHASMATYNQHLRPHLSIIELLRIFALSQEFKYIPVREEEKLEMSKMLERVPVPVKETVEEPTAKINVLLQAYISQLKLDQFALVADMVYVTQSAQRILRAIFEICLARGWAQLTHQALDLCKCAERRMWKAMSPLRQFPNCPAEIIRKAERKDFAWPRWFDLDPPELGELVGLPREGNRIHRLVHQFPKLELQAHVQPITRSLMRIELTVTPDFQWESTIHGSAEAFWVLVEDQDGEEILFTDSLIILQRHCEDDHIVTMTIPIKEPLPPNYFVSVVSDRWLMSESRLSLSFKHLVLPAKFPPPTALFDMQPVLATDLGIPQFEKLYENISSFNKIQTQVFPKLYRSDDSIFVGAPPGSGKTICAEFALLRMWSSSQSQKAVIIEPFQDLVDQRVKFWSKRFAVLDKEVVALTGETASDVALMTTGDLVICTATQWDVFSRRWKQRKSVQAVRLMIADEIHLLGGEAGPAYEIALSRMRFISSQIGEAIRIVACGSSLANARDVGEWLGIAPGNIFNFHPSTRPLPLEIHIQSFTVPHHPSLMIAMARPAFNAISAIPQADEISKPTLLFVPSRKQCRLTADDLLVFAAAEGDEDKFLDVELEELQPHLDRLQDRALADCLAHGIGYYHEALTKRDKSIVEQLYLLGAVRALVVSRDVCWALPLSAYMVIIMGAQYFEGKEHRYIDYPVAEVLHMMGKACRPQVDEDSRAILMCTATKKEFYKKFLNDALPIESHLHHSLHDHFNAEIVTKTIENKQEAVDYLTWTYFYRRLAQNPNYYNLQGTSNQQISDFLSDLVETTLTDLVNSKCISVEDDIDLSPLNLGMIAAYYNISYTTIDIFSMSLTEKTKLKGLLEIVSAASEYDDIPIRNHEEVVLKRIYDRCPVKFGVTNYQSPGFKVAILLQAHFSRIQLPSDLAADRDRVLGKVLNLLSACVDVMSSNAYLNALNAMEMSQMCVQALWDRDSPLKQIPYFDDALVARAKKVGVSSVYDLMDMDDSPRLELLQMNTTQLAEVAKFVNSYPNIEISHSIDQDVEDGPLRAGDAITVNVSLDREIDEDDEKAISTAGEVVAPYFPVPTGRKLENWWIVVADPKSRQLFGIKKVTVQRRLETKVDFTVPKPGSWELQLLVMCDSYLGADQEFNMTLDIAEGLDSDDDEEEDEEDDPNNHSDEMKTES